MSDQATVRGLVIVEINDNLRRRLARQQPTLLGRRHSVVVAADDRDALEIALRVVKSGTGLRSRNGANLGARRAPLVAELLDGDARDRVARSHPGVLRRPHALLLASNDRAALLASLRMLDAGVALARISNGPTTAIAAGTVVLSDAERRSLAVLHPELRRTHAAVAVSYPQASSLLHMHLAVVEEFAKPSTTGVVAVAPSPVEQARLRSRHHELTGHQQLLVVAAADVVAPLREANLLRAVARYRAATATVEANQLT